MFSFIARHKVASALVFVNIVAVLVVILVIAIHNAKTATIDIYVAPSEAVIELNGRKYENFQQYDIMPGDYHVKVAMEGMETKEFDFGIAEGEFKRVRAYLLDAEGGFGYYVENPDEVLNLKEAVSEEGGNVVSGSSEEQIKLAREFVKEYERLISIKDVLPLEYSNTYDFDATEPESVAISWGEGEQCEARTFCLLVHDLTGNNHEMALEMIKEAGFEPSDYEVVFRHWGDEKW